MKKRSNKEGQILYFLVQSNKPVNKYKWFKKYNYRRNNKENQTTGRAIRQPNYYNAHEMANARRLEAQVMKEVRNGY